MTDFSNMQWHVEPPPPPMKEYKVTIVPQYTRELMAKTTTHDVYLWAVKNGVVRRLPRKMKKHIFYKGFGSGRLALKAMSVFMDMWNEFEDAKRKEDGV